jgi:hypothetical protein
LRGACAVVRAARVEAPVASKAGDTPSAHSRAKREFRLDFAETRFIVERFALR